ncbi:MAG: zinc-binding dehydrogenase [Synechococcales cyanobacterium CRU_2_2]|nr:zinc-binding dehydrogenase [Synechococcales cyanobacterium CRU_2_2]
MTLAAVLIAPNVPIQLQQLPAPVVERGSITIRTLYSEVCGTDVHLLRGKLAGVPYPIIPGHFSVGEVVEVGGAVKDIDGQRIQIGSIVTFLDVHETCNSCWYCLVAKTSTRCPERKVYGVTYSAEEGLLGGWSELIYLKPGVKVLTLPQEVSPERFIAGGCALPTALHAIDRAQIQIGDSVVVQGCGPVGLSAAILALMAGAGRVMIIDKFEARLAVARSFGIDDAITISNELPQHHIERVLDLTQGRGADVTIEATGVPIAVKQGIAMTRDGGRYVIVGHYTNTGEVLLNPHLEINRKHIEIRGTWGIDFSHFYRMLQLLKRDRSRQYDIPWENMISRFYRLDEINQALADVEQGVVLKAAIQPNPQ